MAVYEYKATEFDSAAVAGTVVADSPRQARDMLRDRGLRVTEVHTCVPQKVSRLGSSARRGQGEVISFIRELSTLLRVGTPLRPALQTLCAHRGRHFKAAIQYLCDQVTAGVSLAQAMTQQPAYFDDFCANLVRVGENTGHLDSALKRLADFKEKTHRLRSRVITALVYPAVVSTVGTAIAIFLMTYVVPSLLGTLAQSGRPLPTVTRIVKGASDFLIDCRWEILAGLALLALATRALLRIEATRLVIDRLVLRVPVIGDLVRKENTSRMSVVMAVLLRNGLQFVEALRITRHTLRNRVFRSAMDKYEAAVTAGRDIAQPLRATGVFSPMVVHMLAVGQQSGQLEEMLEELSETYDQELATATLRLTAVLEPLLIVIIAVFVGLIAFATLLPILEVSNVL